MSEFDKEAERERLREKYEQDQEDRAATQRMSELLLQGATMTNNHCDDCGDPIFRYDGQAFCPTCQAEGSGADAATADDADDRSTAEADTTEAADSGSNADPDRASAAADTDRPSTPEAADRRAPREAPSADDGRVRDLVEGARAGERDVSGGNRPERAGDAPLETARASLSRTLVRYAQAAEETDDPRRAKELLAAAREAAETLAALR